MDHFRKEKLCPSSYELAEASTCELNGLDGLKLATHLASCEFCAAELSFYRAYPPDGPSVSAEEIPRPLRELAEALMAHETIHISALDHLLRD
jgi:hypothetical protein